MAGWINTLMAQIEVMLDLIDIPNLKVPHGQKEVTSWNQAVRDLEIASRQSEGYHVRHTPMRESSKGSIAMDVKASLKRVKTIYT